MNCFTVDVFYSDGTQQTLGFDSPRVFEDWLHNEGDHVVEYHIPLDLMKDLPKKERYPW